MPFLFASQTRMRRASWYSRADRQTEAPNILDVQRAKLSFKDRTVDGVRQLEQRVLAVEYLIQLGTEQIALIRTALFWLH
jgi:hypothetical protein